MIITKIIRLVKILHIIYILLSGTEYFNVHDNVTF